MAKNTIRIIAHNNKDMAVPITTPARGGVGLPAMAGKGPAETGAFSIYLLLLAVLDAGH